MRMGRSPLPLVLAFALASCSKEPRSATTADAKMVVIKVDGMQRGAGGRT
jgi:hypothetical protein